MSTSQMATDNDQYIKQNANLSQPEEDPSKSRGKRARTGSREPGKIVSQSGKRKRDYMKNTAKINTGQNRVQQNEPVSFTDNDMSVNSASQLSQSQMGGANDQKPSTSDVKQP